MSITELPLIGQTVGVVASHEDQVRGLAYAGMVEEAREVADAAVARAQQTGTASLENRMAIAHALEVKADFHRSFEEYNRAADAYRGALDVLDADLGNDEPIGRVAASLAVVCQNEGRISAAKFFYERAIASFERVIPPALLDIADLSNNLAFIYEEEGEFDQAETLLLGALQISHEQRGLDNKQTASICNNVGTLHFKAEHHQQAREMHTKALESRLRTLGEMHLDTAQSYANLALVFLKTENFETAKIHFNQALIAYEGNLPDGADDYEIVGANYVDLLSYLGESDVAAALQERIVENLG